MVACHGALISREDRAWRRRINLSMARRKRNKGNPARGHAACLARSPLLTAPEHSASRSGDVYFLAYTLCGLRLSDRVHNSTRRRMDKPLGPISEIRKAMSPGVLKESSRYVVGTLRRLYSLVMFGW
jgi:hypothetical protein